MGPLVLFANNDAALLSDFALASGRDPSATVTRDHATFRAETRGDIRKLAPTPIGAVKCAQACRIAMATDGNDIIVHWNNGFREVDNSVVDVIGDGGVRSIAGTS